MSQFAYRLQILLDQKVQAKKDRENEQIKVERELDEQILRLQELEAICQKLIEKRDLLRRELMVKRGEPSITALEVNDRVAYIKVMGEQIEDAKTDVILQKQNIENCKARVEQAKERVAEARREVEVMEKHRAKQEQRFLKILAAKEELALDEVGNVLYTSRRMQS